MPTLFDELATGRSQAYATADFDGGSTHGRVQTNPGNAPNPVSVLLFQLPPGPVAGLAGGLLVYRDATTFQRAVRTILSADRESWSDLLTLVLDGVVTAGDGEDVAVLWPPV